MECLYGGKSYNICAVCGLHKTGMTVKQMRQKECLKKNCWHLKKNEAHEYWKQRERLKQKKKSKKAEFNKMFEAKMGPITM